MQKESLVEYLVNFFMKTSVGELSVNQSLVENSHAVRYYGQSKRSFVVRTSYK